MKRLFFLLMLVILPFFANAENGYKLVCKDFLYNFGLIGPDEVVTHVFKVRNEGNLSFPLRCIRAGCGCTKGKLNTRILDPGAEAELTVTFDAKGRSSNQFRTINVYAENSNVPALTVYMKGYVGKKKKK